MKKAKRWLLGGLLTLLGFASCDKPGADMYGPPPVMYGPGPTGFETRSQEAPSKEELVEPVTPEVEAPEQE